MIANKKEFNSGLLLMVAFWVVFAILMSPVFGGKNCLDFMDNLYNTISKASAYYIPGVKKKAEAYRGNEITITMKAKNAAEADRYKTLLEAGQAKIEVKDTTVTANGDVGLLSEAMLTDADTMFANQGDKIKSKYGSEPQQLLYDWYSISKAMAKELEKANNFKVAKIVYDTQAKAMEPAYNYYGIEATKISDKMGTVILSLIGYVVYTLWFGFAILFMFEGWTQAGALKLARNSSLKTWANQIQLGSF